MIKNRFLFFLSLTFVACEWPFNTANTNEEIFSLTVTHEIERISDSAAVQLSWGPMSVENFSHFRVERLSVVDSDWVLVKDIHNAIMEAHTDYIHDDEDLSYRVGIMDTDENVLWSEGSTTIPKTTYLYVPDEWPTPAKAFKSALIDDGDSILVKAGDYADTLSMVGKTVYVASITELDTAVILSRVWINTGVLKGFTIRDASAARQNGGGLSISGDGQVWNCFIRDNFASRNGGGVYLIEEGALYNSVLFNNVSDYGSMNLFVTGSSGKVINNTFVLAGDLETGNNVTVSYLKDGFEFLNNIVYGSITFRVSVITGDSVTVDYSRMDPVSISGNNIITGDPGFISLDEIMPDFHLMPDSPCIHAGHPNLQYNNVDGTRNTMGAYGGPGGEDY